MQKQFDIDAAVKTLHIGACEISMPKIRGAQTMFLFLNLGSMVRNMYISLTVQKWF